MRVENRLHDFIVSSYNRTKKVSHVVTDIVYLLICNFVCGRSKRAYVTGGIIPLGLVTLTAPSPWVPC